jgi:two-component system nitrate/nitrite response regulator NarL
VTTTPRSRWSGRYDPDATSDYLYPVLRLLAEGRTNAQIGARLGITSNTVKSRLTALYRALGARDRAHAVALGYRRGLLDAAAGHAPNCASRRPCDCAYDRLYAREGS